MAAPDAEATLAHRRIFTEFLDPDNLDGGPMRRIMEMRDAGSRRLVVDLTDLRNFDNALARRLIQEPGEYLPALQKAAEDAVRRVDPKYLQQDQALRGMDASVQIAFEGPMGFNKLTPRELLSPFLNKLVCVNGIVTKCSSVRPKVVKSVHYCPATSMFSSREYRDVTALTGAPTPAVYPTKDDKGNILVTEFGLSTYVDHQVVAIQEMPENSPPGQLPRSIDVIVEDDLVDSAKPGDRVAIYGLYKAAPAARFTGSMSGTFRTVLVATNVQQLNKEVEGPRFSSGDIRAIKQLAARQDVWDVLAESIAPSIYGHRWIKKGLLLLLLGGVEKNLANGTHIRGDLNMMMVGDPSVAKSQLLRAIMSVAPLAISTNGRGSSGVGLTAAVTTDQDTGERRLEAGAMVLADRGIVCVDEFDKMNDIDRVAIHEVMEQQTVTIAKAGIHASLNARCSVLAAANPIYGSYDHSLTPTRNIALPDSLLSRFDLLFIVVDHMDADVDRKIAEHVLRMHRYRPPGDDGTTPATDAAAPQYEDAEEEEAEDAEGGGVYVKYDQVLHGSRGQSKKEAKTLVTRKFLKKFIHYAHGRTPRLSDEAASEKVAQAYAEMRAQGMGSSTKPETGGTLPVTARSLETIIRLSTAHAKLKLHQQVKVSDVDAALKLLDFALYHRELSEVDKRLEEEKEQRAREERERRKKEAAEQRHKEGQEEHGAKRQRAAGEAAEEAGVPADAQDEGPDAEGNEAGDAEEAREGEAAEAGAPEAEEDALDVSPGRVTLFQAAFSEHAMAARLETIPIDDLIEAVNRRQPANPFSKAEVESILRQMEEQNRVMYTGGVVHLI